MFKEALQALTGKNKELKERFKEAQTELKIQKTIVDSPLLTVPFCTHFFTVIAYLEITYL